MAILSPFSDFYVYVEVSRTKPIPTTYLIMNNPYASLGEKELLDHLKTHDPLAFSALYDRYAASLLGVITKIVHDDELEASVLLEKAFVKIQSQIVHVDSAKQSLFVWLLDISRQTAIDALKERRTQSRSATQLTATNQVRITPPHKRTSNSVPVVTDSIDPQLKKLLDSVLFKSCTPEEAAASLGIPAESARQQLRLAMQQIRKA